MRSGGIGAKTEPRDCCKAGLVMRAMLEAACSTRTSHSRKPMLAQNAYPGCRHCRHWHQEARNKGYNK